MKIKKQPHPFINGFALSSPFTFLLHAIPWPTDLGSHGPALCNTTDAPGEDGWVERADLNEEEPRNYVYCNACLMLYRRMVEDNDPRLNTEDRNRFHEVIRHIVDGS